MHVIFALRVASNLLMTGPKVNKAYHLYEPFYVQCLENVLNDCALLSEEIDSWSFQTLQAHLTYAKSVQVGTQIGIEECKHQFAWDRWNCPDSATQQRGLRLGM